MEKNVVAKVFQGILKAYEWFLMLVLSVMISVVFVNVFSRYVLNHSLGWVDELSRFLFIWLVFLGAVLAFEKNEHIGLDFFVGYVPEKYRKFVFLLTNILVLVALVIITRYGYLVSMRARNISPGLGIRMTYVYIVVPIGGFFMSLIALRRILEQVIAIFAPAQVSSGKKVDA